MTLKWFAEKNALVDRDKKVQVPVPLGTFPTPIARVVRDAMLVVRVVT